MRAVTLVAMQKLHGTEILKIFFLRPLLKDETIRLNLEGALSAQGLQRESKTGLTADVCLGMVK